MKIIIFTVLCVALIVAVKGLVLMWLWNWLMPDLFDLPEIAIWQAMGISLLSAFIFKKVHNSSENKDK